MNRKQILAIVNSSIKSVTTAKYNRRYCDTKKTKVKTNIFGYSIKYLGVISVTENTKIIAKINARLEKTQFKAIPVTIGGYYRKLGCTLVNGFQIIRN